jgi:prolyl-tRNA synthetase
MFWSRFFIPTVKETPADAAVPSHQLAIRAGLIRQVAAGSYTYLPLGYRSLRKIEDIIREEMNRAGAIELHMPALHPLAWWEETGRAAIMGDVLLRIKGSSWQAGVVLGPTHEEVITETVRAYVSSYKQLPLNLYQIQTKFRGEERPKSGVLRTREFQMKDAYSFDADKAGLDLSYQKMYAAYCQIFKRCGLPYMAVEAESGPIGGDASHEFMVLTDAGEDFVAISEDGQYAANLERATRTIAPLPADPDESAMHTLQEVHTPNCPGIEDVCTLLKVTPQQMVKTLVYEIERAGASEEKGRSGGGKGPAFVIACVRGDHEVNENKLKRICRERGLEGNVRMAGLESAATAGFAIGYVGPHVVNGAEHLLIVDPDARAVVNAVTGANRPDHHVTGFNWARELKPDCLTAAVVTDVRNAVEGDLAPTPPAAAGSRLRFAKAIEIGHVFKLGTKYSDAMDATFLDSSGRPQKFIMGCYGIGVNRILAAAIEAHHDADGIIWPVNIAPFEVIVVALDTRDETVQATAKKIHDTLCEQGVDVLMDDRDERPGFKFKDADLIGIPIRITVGKKGLADGVVELKMRAGKDVEKLSPEAAIEEVAKRVQAARA